MLDESALLPAVDRNTGYLYRVADRSRVAGQTKGCAAALLVRNSVTLLASIFLGRWNLIMPREKTVIVLGAGASREAGLPTGAELKEEIASLLNFRVKRWELIGGDDTIMQALLSVSNNSDQHIRTGRWIGRALTLATSIDSFIDNHQGNAEVELCGKLSIVKSILDAERRSAMAGNSREGMSFGAIENTWFTAFWKKLSENCPLDELADRLSSFVLVNFNYDRCVEHFLFHSIQSYYGTDAGMAASLVNSIKIFHPYGTVGSLPWADSEVQMEFGADPSIPSLRLLADQIRTYAEATSPIGGYADSIRSFVTEADTLIFLGFAYHQQNLELLIEPRYDTDQHSANYVSTTLLGTAHEISEPDRKMIERDLRTVTDRFGQIEIRSLTCHQFFEEYWRTLSDYLWNS